MNEDYARLIGDARLSVYDSIVEGRPFAKMAAAVIYDATSFGERAARNCDVPVSGYTSGVEFEVTDNASYDYSLVRATAATEALGKMFSGDMAGVVEMLVHTGIQFGYATERKKIALRSPQLAEMFDAIVESMNLSDNKMIPDAPASAFFEALFDAKDGDLAIYYTKRLFTEQGLRVNIFLPAVKAFMNDYSRILM